MNTWWRGTGLVFRRALVENLRSRAFKVVTGILLLVSVAAVTLPQLLASDTKTYTLATVGEAPAAVVATLDAAGRAGDFEVDYVTRDSAEELRQAVRHREATVGLTADTIYATAREAGTFPAIVAQTVVTLETSRRLSEAGLSPRQIVEIQSVRPPRQVSVAAVGDESRAYVGLAVGVVLYLALNFGGNIIATTVATEKSTRISEVLLAVLRPSQILTGTVLAIGMVTFLEFLVLAAPLAVSVRITEDNPLPAVASGDLVLAVVWFVLGFALYAFMYAAAGALVDKVTEVSTATAPLSVALLFGYLLSFFVVMESPDSPWTVLASMFPITAPLTMPLRWASGEVPVYQLVVAMALTAVTAVGLLALASTIYRRALLITGHRVRFRELVGGPPAP